MSRLQLVVPNSLVPTVLMYLHDADAAGHPGKSRCLTEARAKYYWVGMENDIASHVDQCLSCARHKGTVESPAPLLAYPAPDLPWESVSIDLLSLPRSTQGNCYLLVCVDRFSRFIVMSPIPNKSAEVVAHALVTDLILPFTAPRVILSDNGAEFNNAVLVEICAMFKIKQCFTASYHPSSNGLVERANRKILESLRHC
ncbi:MAG: transposase family protein, partial [Aestuariibacter sp.]|nr:transposase family protein [Aestuariibacter sp.]